jgi:DNA-binding transcriptional LysR family regulator
MTHMTNLSVLHDMTLFVEVARTGNFSLASVALGVPGATLSRRIAAMERELGVRLFNRTTRRVELTDAGKRYFERCGRLVDEAHLAQEALREDATRPSGHIRVSMPVDLGVYIIGPLLSDFARQYPDITFDLDLSPKHADLIGDQLDVAIRLSPIKNDKLVARRIGSIAMALFAAPAYLDSRGHPAQPADLLEHECIEILGEQPQPSLWRLQRDNDSTQVTVRGRFKLNNLGLMRVLAERGMGVAVLATPLVRDAVVEGRLVQVLPDWVVPALPIHAVMFSRLQSASVRALLDFLAARLAII